MFLKAVFIVYIFGLLYFTIFAESLGRTAESMNGELRYNLVLFNEIRRFVNYREQLGNSAVILNLAGNVLAFIPFGLLFPMFFKQVSAFSGTLVFGVLTSFLIECTQLVFRVGSFDVDDLMLNSIGVLVGIILYFVIRTLYLRRMERRQITIRRLEFGKEVNG